MNKPANKSVWETLSAINVNDHVEKKGRFSYLSWAWAWGTLKSIYPDSALVKHTFTSDNATDVPYMRDAEGQTYVQVSVTVEGLTLTETYPVLNHQNKSITNPNSFDVNTALQRCLAKVIAMHGLGFYIFVGEDLPEAGIAQEDVDAADNTGNVTNLKEKPVISLTQLETLRQMIKETDTDEGAFTQYLKVEKLQNLAPAGFDVAMNALEKKQAAQEKAHAD